VPLTPETWLAEFSVANFAGTQREPQITQLANGNILVAWEDDTNNVDTSNGTDIIGQIYDPLGNPVGSAFQLNSSFIGDDEGEFEIAGLPGGGFVVVYEDTNLNGTSIRVTERDSAGALVQTLTVESDPGADELNDPSVTIAANGDWLIAFNRTDDVSGTVTAYTRLYDDSAGAFTAPAASVLASSNSTTTGTTQNNSVTALTDGSYVLVTPRAFGSDDIIGRKIDAAGNTPGGFFTISVGGTTSTQPDVVALNGGGFAVAWQQLDATDTDAFFRIFDNAGAPVTSEIAISGAGSTDNKNEISIGALEDGGFVVVWDDDETNEIRGQRYDATGSTVGSEFLVTDSSAESQPEIVGLGDGRFAVTWQTTQGLGSQSIEMAIFDTRDAANSPNAYTGDLVIGTIGSDTIEVVDADDGVFAWDGNDTLRFADAIGNFNDTFDGGIGSDRILLTEMGTVSFDTVTILGMEEIEFEAGANEAKTGIFTAQQYNSGGFAPGLLIDGNTNGGIASPDILRFLMQNETTLDLSGLTFTGWQSSFDLVNIVGDSSSETITGTSQRDFIEGGNGANMLNGGGGGDILTSGTGADTLNGGTGADSMTGGGGNDSYIVDNVGDLIVELGGGGDDTVFTSVDYTMGANTEVGFITVGTGASLTGNAQSNFLFGGLGEDIIVGGAGSDQMTGGGGNDTYAVDNSSDAVVEGAGGGFDNVYSSVNYEINEAQEIESALLSGGSAAAVILRGSSSDNQLIGNEFVNVIDGRGGTDYMLGLGGADIFQIGPEAGAVDVIGDFSKSEGDRIALAGFNAATTTVTQVSATSFQVVDTSPGGVTQQFILNDAIGNPNYSQGPLVLGDDFYFA